MNKQNTTIGGIDILVQGRWNNCDNPAKAEFEYKILDKQSNVIAHRDGSSVASLKEVESVIRDLQNKGSRVSTPTFIEKVSLASIIATLANITYPLGRYT
jgi:hypothetical protein